MADGEDVQTVEPVIAPDNNIDPDRGIDGGQRTEVETLAMEMGWNPDHVPADGKASRTAAEWIKSTDANNRNLKREVKELKGSVERIVAASDRAVKREVEAKAKEIEARFHDAVENKDTAAAAAAANEMRSLEREQQAPETGGGDAVTQFQRDNPWYGTDADATDYAVSVSNRLAREGVTDPAAQLARVREAVLKRFPEHGEGKPQSKTPLLNEPGSRANTKPRGKTFADMPEVARKAADRFFEAAKMRGTAPDRKAFDAQYATDFWAESA
jgi:hypothetical protein